MAVELKHNQILAETREAAQIRKRTCSGRDSLLKSKRTRKGQGKPRGRRGGRHRASATGAQPPTECSLSSSVGDLPTLPSASPLAKFEKNMERLSAILASCHSDEPQSSASSWSFRQQKASERWRESRPYNLQCLIEKEAVGHPLCCLCNEPAVIRCRDCLPEEWFCGDCDVLHHKKQPLHNRESIIDVFFKAIPPTTQIMKQKDGYCTHEQACILPAVKAPCCSFEGTNIMISPGKPVILITINGRYDLHQPLYLCGTCQRQWTPELNDLIRSGYWPASLNVSTLCRNPAHAVLLAGGRAVGLRDLPPPREPLVSSITRVCFPFSNTLPSQPHDKIISYIINRDFPTKAYLWTNYPFNQILIRRTRACVKDNHQHLTVPCHREIKDLKREP
ncbi:uncharacterized protein LOC115576745 isoform X3 [Sparus aurata]|nr:uncharacterized protein LOC115576745 isoform X3 [Sparus aurata]XP_030265167.1 uncharacterized protein LOC115576745 isoform X3 [Sparus aurata]